MGQLTLATSTLRERSRLERAMMPLLEGVEVTAVKAPLLSALADAMDLTGAIALADRLRARKRAALHPDPSAETHPESSLRNRVLSAQRSMLELIAASFAPDAHTAPIPLPRLDQGAFLDGLSVAERLQRFYSHHQREMEASVQQLRVTVRTDLATRSPELAQVAALDRILGPAVEQSFEKVWAVIPRLVGRHFETLSSKSSVEGPGVGEGPVDATGNHAEASPHGETRGSANSTNIAWQQALLVRVGELLLAELELRLQPVLGLLEASETHREQIS